MNKHGNLGSEHETPREYGFDPAWLRDLLEADKLARNGIDPVAQDILSLTKVLHRVTLHLAEPAFRVNPNELKDMAAQLQAIIQRIEGGR